jgi:hypothetical protein
MKRLAATLVLLAAPLIAPLIALLLATPCRAAALAPTAPTATLQASTPAAPALAGTVDLATFLQQTAPAPAARPEGPFAPPSACSVFACNFCAKHGQICCTGTGGFGCFCSSPNCPG